MSKNRNYSSLSLEQFKLADNLFPPSLFSVSTFVSILMLEFSAIYKYFQGRFKEEKNRILSYIKNFKGK
ncbi:MAG: hypothetical protein DRJ06_09035 [Candidatus Aminicenantes bacterium]|nr:MAG: hypothetical protein DRJ06_09035 [Candidatus Aminicenantes bacterium]